MKSAIRALVLSLVLGAGFSLIYALPKSYGLRESAIIKAFPIGVGEWKSHPQETPERVSAILGKSTFHQQTTFFRRLPDGKYDRLSMFMVVSGEEMNASIHRPERCFPTQGINITDSSEVELEAGGLGRPLTATRLDAYGLNEEGGQIKRLSYYWFVGSDRLTNSHYERAWTDMKDRVLKGSNQRWGYVMATIEYDLEAEGLRFLSEAEADEIVGEFLTELFPHIHRIDQLKG